MSAIEEDAIRVTYPREDQVGRTAMGEGDAALPVLFAGQLHGRAFQRCPFVAVLSDRLPLPVVPQTWHESTETVPLADVTERAYATTADFCVGGGCCCCGCCCRHSG